MNNYKLPDFCNYVMGQSPSSQFYNSNREGLPFLQGCTTFGRMFPTFDTWTTQYTRTCKPNDVLMSVRAPVGDLNISRDVIALGRGVAALSMKQGDNRYLYYLLMANRQKLSSCSTGTIYESISKTQLENIVFDVHEPEEQRHIVDILGSIDEEIENNEQLINIFENLAAKKYLDFANKTSTKIRLEDVIELFDSKRIPLSSREREQRKGIYPYYGATGILDYVNGFLFSGEHVLFAEDGTVTDTNGHPIVQLVNGSFWVNNHAHILKGKNGWNDYTLYVALKQINVDKAVTGAVQPKINQANLLSLEIPNLSNNNLQTINTELDVVFHKVFHLRSENKKLQELKGLYLKKFFE
jgi:type I restriction enzyme S subunit